MSAVAPLPVPIEAEAAQGLPLRGVSNPPDSQQDNSLHRRQCSRCRELFEGDPKINAAALRGWWLCPICQITLLGEPQRQPTIASIHPSVGMRRVR